jgi:hypothetical protein
MYHTFVIFVKSVAIVMRYSVIRITDAKLDLWICFIDGYRCVK